MPSALRSPRGRARARLRAAASRLLVAAPLATALLATALLATALPAAALPTTAPPPAYQPPVDAAVSDPFRPPATPYGPGNRGLEYDTHPGTEVRAAADGRVSFAGSVAGSRHVTVLHPDGLRTTASYLATVAVVVGQQVEQGELLGTTEGRLHFSARAGDGYLDPAALFGTGPLEVWLVPFERPPGPGLAGERSAIRQLLASRSGVLDLARRAAGASGAVVAWVGSGGGELAQLAWEYGPLVVPPLRTARMVLLAVDGLHEAWVTSRRPCTRDDVAVPPPVERRAAVLVGGLGSTSGSASVDQVDVGTLGYEPRDVVRFSYAGGRTPQSSGHPVGVPARRYAGADTQRDLRESGRRLADLVQGLAASFPGVPIDLIAHSQGGVVARLAVAELERRGRADVVASLATLGSPHDGADLATAVHAIGLLPAGRAALERIGSALDLDPSAPTAEQLSEASAVVDELARSPLPEGLPAVSIAARGDLVVPVPRTELAGARSVVVPLAGLEAHSALPGDPRTTRELALALAGAPPGCRGLAGAVLDQAVGRSISLAEDHLGLLGSGAAALGSPIAAADAALEGAPRSR